MPFDFHKLKTISVANGEVTLRIPERWDVFPHERIEGSWGCFEEDIEGEDTDTGTLWIKVDHYMWNGEGEPPGGFGSRAFADSARARSLPELPPLLADEITEVEEGHRWYRVYDVEEDGEMIRFWFSHFFLGRPGHIATVSFNFVLAHCRMDDPEFVELREIMEREIGAAFLDVFKTDDEEAAEACLGPLRLCNFDDRVKLVLPEAMSITIDEESDPANPRWYCRLSAGTSYAGMFVEWRALAMRDEDGDPVHLPPKMYEEVLAGILKDDGGSGRYTAMPAGIIARDIYEDKIDLGEIRENGRPFEGFCNHAWRYLHIGDGMCNLLTVLLMLPLPEKDRATYRDLAGYMNGAVRRAQFPGLPSPVAY